MDSVRRVDATTQEAAEAVALLKELLVEMEMTLHELAVRTQGHTREVRAIADHVDRLWRQRSS